MKRNVKDKLCIIIFNCLVLGIICFFSVGNGEVKDVRQDDTGYHSSFIKDLIDSNERYDVDELLNKTMSYPHCGTIRVQDGGVLDGKIENPVNNEFNLSVIGYIRASNINTDMVRLFECREIVPGQVVDKINIELELDPCEYVAKLMYIPSLSVNDRDLESLACVGFCDQVKIIILDAKRENTL